MPSIADTDYLFGATEDPSSLFVVTSPELESGGTLPAVMNAANEAAVNAFLGERVPFAAIARTIEDVMSRHEPRGLSSLEAVLEADAWARRQAEEILSKGKW